MFIGNVFATYEIEGRGVSILTDNFPKGLKLRIGDTVELRMGPIAVLRTKVAGIELGSWTPEKTFCFLVQSDVRKEDVPLGAEIWSVD